MSKRNMNAAQVAFAAGASKPESIEQLRKEAEADTGTKLDPANNPQPIAIEKVEDDGAPIVASDETIKEEVQTSEPKIESPINGDDAKLSGDALIEKYGNKSRAIRALSQQGMKTGDIAKKLGILYQHARNVLNQPLKREIAAQRQQTH